ncbi:hypothetical protein HYW75_02890 [Candidatus Pacearchaeota archaeon]|nr:hypothetical protein [Candidatus Pacearchaeota archaeon]
MIRKGKNYTSELTNYFKRNLKKGYTKESLRWALISQGHSKMEVEKALQLVEKEMASEAPILKTKPEIKVEIIEPSNAVIEKKSWWKNLLGF